ncbi:PAS domain S-box protein [Mucilaginibacter terrenus]|uniref:PAS domain S-box protein n=1 Tax=Mucilaginibacter terrenus TaxID=2482727 RepID=A0A3E2NQL2_9SPHI|nr:PAS domain S-box protein [Mucilaginibacter terrenus]RFZ83263.1 PAS domain S-box protein [Mucilaginibacter terrenus]
MKIWWPAYERALKSRLSIHFNHQESDLRFWQNKLFLNFLVYCLPVSFIAVVPGVFMALKDGYTFVAVIDLLALLGVAFATYSNKLSFRTRKIVIIAVFYLLAVCLINTLGYVGPGVFYLFVITILMALLFKTRYAYWSILCNTVTLLAFAAVIAFKPFNSALTNVYSPGQWIAFSSNLPFLSIVIVLLIERIFRGLQNTIESKDNLQERYKNIFQLSPLPMWLFDTETLRFLDVNEAAVRHYGYSTEEFLSMTIRQLRPVDKVLALEQIVRQNAATGNFYNDRADHIKKDGTEINVRIESSLIVLDGRKVRLVLATDITEKVKNERGLALATAKLRESENNLRAIFDSATEGFLLLDAGSNIKAFNKKGEEYIKLNSFTSDFKTGINIFDILEPGRVSYFKDSIAQVLKGAIIQYDRNYPKAGADDLWMQYTLSPVYEDDQICGVCVTGQNISNRKNYTRKIEQQNKVFRDISWMQSHLVRAPLARIMGLVSLLDSAQEHAEREEIQEYLKQSANELNDVILKITESTTKSILE